MQRTDADAGAVSGWSEGQLGDSMVSSRSSAANTSEPNLDSGLICTTAHVGLEVESDDAWGGRAVETLTLFRFCKAWHSARRPYLGTLRAHLHRANMVCKNQGRRDGNLPERPSCILDPYPSPRPEGTPTKNTRD